MGCDRGSNPGVGLVQDGQRLPSQLFNLSGVPPKSTLRGGGVYSFLPRKGLVASNPGTQSEPRLSNTGAESPRFSSL